MSHDQEHRLEEVFIAAHDLPPLEQVAFLDGACGADATLRQEVESLLQAHANAGNVLQPTVLLEAPGADCERLGAKIGCYKLIEKIGEEGFEVVWMAEQEEPVRRPPNRVEQIGGIGFWKDKLNIRTLSMILWLSPHTRRISACTLFHATLLALTCLLTGCIGVLPFPQLSNQPTHGTKLQARDTAFIRVGTTPASELFGALGTNCVCDPRQRAVAFPWEMPGGRGVWWVFSTAGGGGGEFEWSRWRAFFVAFDANNLVIAANTKHLSSSKSLHEHLEVWAKKHHAAPDHIHPDTLVAKPP